VDDDETSESSSGCSDGDSSTDLTYSPAKKEPKKKKKTDSYESELPPATKKRKRKNIGEYVNQECEPILEPTKDSKDLAQVQVLFKNFLELSTRAEENKFKL
jgi:hypothetical protein